MVWKDMLVEEFQDGSFHFAWSFLSCFWSREYMVWKKILVEEFQDWCLGQGHLWFVNGVILAILSLHNAGSLNIKFLLKLTYGLEEDVGWKIHRWLFSAWPSLICKSDNFAISESPFCRKPSISFWSKNYMVWKKMLVEKFKDGCIVHGHIWCVNGVILAIS